MPRSGRRLGRRTVLFIDEIHRFNKAQQDAFLPYVEKGDVILIGATTENPSFEVISALLSRAKVYALRALTPDEIVVLLRARWRRARPRRLAWRRRRAAGADRGLRERRCAVGVQRARSWPRRRPSGRARSPRRAIEDALQRKMLLYDKPARSTSI